MNRIKTRPVGLGLCGFGAVLVLAALLADKPGAATSTFGTKQETAAFVGACLAVGGCAILASLRSHQRWRPFAVAIGVAVVVLACTLQRYQSGASAGIGLGQLAGVVFGLALICLGVGAPTLRNAMRSVPVPLAVLVGLGILVRLWFVFSDRPGFFGYPDATGYLAYAQGDIFATPYRPAGEAIFVRLLRQLSPDLTLTVVAHHALGVLTAILLYLAVRRAGASVRLALVPAAVVLFSGTQIFLEHSTMSEPTFTFLAAAGVYCFIRGEYGRRPGWLAAAGALLALATVVRTVGLILIPLLGAWLLFARVDLRRRVIYAAALGASAAVVLVAYLGAHHQKTGSWGITRAQGLTLYARAATFANCSRFTPPPGTRALCQSLAPDKRPAAIKYMFNPSVSPAIKAFGIPPVPNPSHSRRDFRWTPDAKLGEFGRDAIKAQPLDYLRTIGQGMANYVLPAKIGPPSVRDWDTSELVAQMVSSYEAQAQTFFPSYYTAGTGYQRKHVNALYDYARAARIEGPVTLLLTLIILAGLLFGRGPLRRPAATFAIVAFGLMLATVASLYYDARYATPTYGFLAASAALAAGALTERSGNARQQTGPTATLVHLPNAGLGSGRR